MGLACKIGSKSFKQKFSDCMFTSLTQRSHSVFHPGKELLPWDVALLLGRFHKKISLVTWDESATPRYHEVCR